MSITIPQQLDKSSCAASNGSCLWAVVRRRLIGARGAGPGQHTHLEGILGGIRNLRGGRRDGGAPPRRVEAVVLHGLERDVVSQVQLAANGHKQP